MRLLAHSKPELPSTQPGWHGRAVRWLLLGAPALSLSGCGSPSNPDEVQGFVISLLVFIAVVFIISSVGILMLMRFVLRAVGATTAPIKNGLPGDAIIESMADTGMTITSPGVGPDAPRYKLGLQVTPAGGAGAPYQVEVTAVIPRLYIPMLLPGAHIGVVIDPTNPMEVSLDFSRIGSASTVNATAAAGASGGMDFAFDADGRPASGDVSALVGAVRSGTLPTIKGSADRLLATGTHGTATVTTAMPLGKTVRDINPAADPSRLDDPVWLFTVEVTLAGQAPFPAVFGHRVPLAKLASVAPGVKVAVAVDPANPYEEVAIDWDKSPIGA